MTTTTPLAPHLHQARGPAAAHTTTVVRLRGATVAARDLVVLDDVDLQVAAGTMVALAGPSGAGKTTLLEALAGLRSLDRGTREAADGRIGFVPQDDIVHHQLPLRRMLDHAARLRLPGLTAPLRSTVVQEVLGQLDLLAQADVRVGALSGGQRKRASLAAELLTQPRVLFLDEPTSGLDPVSAAEVLSVLRGLRDRGVTVVMTTHDPAQLSSCDHVVLVAAGGQVAYDGPADEVVEAFGVSDVVDVYPLLAARTPRSAEHRSRAPRRGIGERAARRRQVGRPVGSFAHQVRVLARRSAEVMAADRLTLAVLVGSPALVITMMAVLFPPGGFGRTDGELGATQTMFWIAFSGFFFGLTYGLLQIVGERAIVAREQVAGLRATAYVAAKVAVLLPVLVGISAALLGVLRLLDRLPAEPASTYGVLLVVLVVESLAALLLGLAASALVHDAAQATLALPMLCFPQVLFAGAVVPTDEMAGTGVAISQLMATRWAFESLARGIALDDPRLGSALAGSWTTGCLIMATMAAVAAVVTVAALQGRRPRR